RAPRTPSRHITENAAVIREKSRLSRISVTLAAAKAKAAHRANSATAATGLRNRSIQAAIHPSIPVGSASGIPGEIHSSAAAASSESMDTAPQPSLIMGERYAGTADIGWRTTDPGGFLGAILRLGNRCGRRFVSPGRSPGLI